jgi:DNA-binding NarL/FixJ family response regulator
LRPVGAGVLEMVIMGSLDEKDNINLFDADKSANPYIYLVDNAQKMMLILKRDLSEINGNRSADEAAAIQDLIAGKMQNLMERMNSVGPLSLREMEILNYAALGKSNKQIAEIVGLSESTVKNHFSNTLKKLHANDRTHAVTLALCNGWLSVQNISTILENQDAAAAALVD